MIKRILLVEDEAGLVMTLTDRLQAEGYAVEAAGDGETALLLGLARNYDLIILDVMLPDRNGVEICRELRQRRVRAPVLMLTARSQLADKVLGLKLGADDYLSKPFEMLELLARIEALLRRASNEAQANDAERYRFGTVEVDVRQASVCRDGEPLELSALEFRLLRYFIEHRGETLSRDELLNDVWGYNALVSTRTVDVHVAWLRQKLEVHSRHPRYILTVHGVGYKFVG